tara:strand:+ start:1780 stop:1929 length:150 start_codon:yes stop_codon:yes gene_type:complete
MVHFIYELIGAGLGVGICLFFIHLLIKYVGVETTEEYLKRREKEQKKKK